MPEKKEERIYDFKPSDNTAWTLCHHCVWYKLETCTNLRYCDTYKHLEGKK